MEDAISRILYRLCGDGGHSSWTDVAIGLKRPTRSATSLLGEDKDGQSLRRNLFGLAPGGGCQALMVTHQAGGLLPHRFTLTGGMVTTGGLFSVALSLGLPPVGVTDLPALRCPDFPLPSTIRMAATTLHPPFSIYYIPSIASFARLSARVLFSLLMWVIRKELNPEI